MKHFYLTKVRCTAGAGAEAVEEAARTTEAVSAGAEAEVAAEAGNDGGIPSGETRSSRSCARRAGGTRWTSTPTP